MGKVKEIEIKTISFNGEDISYSSDINEIIQTPDKLSFKKDGEFHNLSGPAVTGYKEWYINGKSYQEDSPAVERVDGYKEWYLNGCFVSEEKVMGKVEKVEKVVKVKEEKFSLSTNRLKNLTSRKHMTHYLKWSINATTSLRFYITFHDQIHKEGKWFLKNHPGKNYLELKDEKLIKNLIDLSIEKDEPEIIFGLTTNKYKKVVSTIKI